MTILSLWTNQLFLPTTLLLGLYALHQTISNYHTWPASTLLSWSIYIILPLHAYEEWVFPGGFGWQYNWVMGTSSTMTASSSPSQPMSTHIQPDRYPMDKLTHMMMLWGGMCYGLGLLVVFGGDKPAVVISRLVFAALEVLVHVRFGLKMKEMFVSKRKTTIYNPGLFTALAGFLPVVVAGLWVLGSMVRAGEVGGWDVLATMGLMVGSVAITILPGRMRGSERQEEFAFKAGYFAKFVEGRKVR